MIRVALLVAGKDLRIERRSRILLWQVVPFGVMALLLSGLALGPNHVGHSSAAPGLFYLVIVLVALLMINRSHAIESKDGTRASVATLGLDPAGVFLGKAAALAVELWLTAIVLLAGSVVVLHTALHGTLVATPSILVIVGAIAGAGTLYGALTSGGNAAATLLPVLSLPAFAPLLIAGERSFNSALHGGAFLEWWVISVVALAVYMVLGILLYGVLEES
ncbi:MAG TPA: heme exporter protein CcmB [Acidimicrobiales bacterium]|nr:heme exporter protein CcmB [Acidimicrobiales bacterium]